VHHPNFCVECGERLTRRGWRAWPALLDPHFCKDCRRRLGRNWVKPIAIMSVVAISAFAFGKYSRQPAPPLLIQRVANSPLSDSPVTQNESDRASTRKESGATTPGGTPSNIDEPGYICGARTKKGTPCHRRVHAAGERCFQHKGMPAILPSEKLVIHP
jgi:hypothetical protein